MTRPLASIYPPPFDSPTKTEPCLTLENLSPLISKDDMLITSLVNRSFDYTKRFRFCDPLA